MIPFLDNDAPYMKEFLQFNAKVTTPGKEVTDIALHPSNGVSFIHTFIYHSSH